MYLWAFPNRDVAVGALAGTLASTIAVLVAHPVESVKVRMQSGQRGGRPGDPLWQRVAGLLRKPYYGIGPHLLQYSALNAVRFGSYSAAKASFERQHLEEWRGEKRDLPITEVFGCGAFSGLCIAASLHPFWVVKAHQQINRLGVVEACSRLWQAEGVRGLYRGYVSGFVRFPFALGVFFAAYEALKRPDLWTGGAAARDAPSHSNGNSGTAAGWLGRAGSGAFAGIICWTSIYPLDVVQHRVMGDPAYGADRVYTGAVASFRKIYSSEGLGAFTRGYSAVLLRSGPVNAVLLPVNDALNPFVERLLPPA